MNIRVKFVIMIHGFMRYFISYVVYHINSILVVIMKPQDMIEFSKHYYEKQVTFWSKTIDKGLKKFEKKIVEMIPEKNQKKLLILGVGGGREAIPLAEMGFDVTGLDQVPEMLKVTEENCRNKDINIKLLNQDFCNLQCADESYDVVWLSFHTYSTVAGYKRRISMLRSFYRCLTENGYFFCSFFLKTNLKSNPIFELLKWIIIIITAGNFSYQIGDGIPFSHEFLRFFRSENELINEFTEGGFEVVEFIKEGTGGYVLARKKKFLV